MRADRRQSKRSEVRADRRQSKRSEVRADQRQNKRSEVRADQKSEVEREKGKLLSWTVVRRLTGSWKSFRMDMDLSAVGVCASLEIMTFMCTQHLRSADLI